MSIDYKTPAQISDQYLLHLKSLKPEVDTKKQDGDWWIRSQVVGGVFSGIYADQKKIANDPFPQSARREGLGNSLQTYFGEGFKQPTPSVGNVIISGATGSVFNVGTQFEYQPNGNLYASTETINFGTAATASVPVKSVATGQNQNLLENAPLSIPSPPAGVSPTAAVFGGPLSDGRNEETNPEAAARLLTQIRSPLAGGKVSDYQQFALQADPNVTSASILRWPFGLGTVGVVITAGTTDIDTALDNGDPIVLVPSDALIDRVQTYIDSKNPLNDCATVLRPASVGIDVTVTVRYASGNSATVLSGQTLTQSELVKREVSRAIYKTPPGGRKFGASGFVVASEIEEVMDSGLSSGPFTIGSYVQILSDRQVLDLSASGANRKILGTEIPFPGVITVVEQT